MIITGCVGNMITPQLTEKNNIFSYNLSQNSVQRDIQHILKRIKVRKNKYTTPLQTRFLSSEIYHSVSYLVNDFKSPLCLGNTIIQITASPNSKAHFKMNKNRAMTLGIFDLKRGRGTIEHEIFHAFYQNKSALNNKRAAEGWAMYSQLRYLYPRLSNARIRSTVMKKYRISPQELEVFEQNAKQSTRFFAKNTRDYVMNALILFEKRHQNNLSEYFNTYQGKRAKDCIVKKPSQQRKQSPQKNQVSENKKRPWD